MRPRLPALVIPCALTVAGLAAGLMGASALSSGEVASGVSWVLLGQGLDIADGRVARAMRAESRLGALLDYSSDVVVTVALLAAIQAWGLIFFAALLQTAARECGARLSGRTAAAVAAAAVALGGCGPGTLDSSTDAGDICPAIAEASPDAVALTCARHPWEPMNCGSSLAPPTCPDVLAMLEPCGLTLCAYEACADALAVRQCDEPRPVECEPISECLE